MTTFDRVLPELLAASVPTAARLERVGVIRDVRGRVRLVVRPGPECDATTIATLEHNLTERLGAFFAPPILSAGGGGESARLAQRLLDHAQEWPLAWPKEVEDLVGTRSPLDMAKWFGVDRTIGKEAWLTRYPPTKPWPLIQNKTPGIITFHSFKGGVGRTTLVAAHALRLAQSRRVAVIDLDLEAPGVGPLFGVETRRGVLDVLVDHLATGTIDLSGTSERTSAPHSVTVFPAGRVDDGFVQKLARLDYCSAEPGADNPVGVALKATLKSIKNDFDVILLDARAGLHDLAGMSLHGLAHVDVLVFRGTNQGLTGLEQTIRTLGRMEKIQLVLIETLLPANEPEVFDQRHGKSRERAYRVLLDHFYDDEEPPQESDAGEPHDVVAVRRKDWLEALDNVVEQARPILADDDFMRVSQRIDDACHLADESTDEAM